MKTKLAHTAIQAVIILAGIFISCFGVFLEIVGVMAGHPDDLLIPATVIAASGGVIIGQAIVDWKR
jgi:hypothetical protein